MKRQMKNMKQSEEDGRNTIGQKYICVKSGDGDLELRRVKGRNAIIRKGTRKGQEVGGRESEEDGSSWVTGKGLRR